MNATTVPATPTKASALSGSVQAELLRLRAWPAVWVLVAVWLALNLAFTYVFNYVAYATGSSSFATEGVSSEALLADVLPAAIPDVITNGMPMFGGAILMILGALASGSGYGWGTWKTVMTQGPGRLSAFGGTLAAVGAIVVGVIAVTLLVDLASSTLITVLESRPFELPDTADLARSVGGGLLISGMWASAGVMIGVLARSPALAIGLGLVWSMVVENLLRSVSSALSGMEYVTDVMPGTAAGSMAGALSGGADNDGEGAPGVLTILDGGTAAIVLAVYITVFAAIAAVVVRRRDVT